MKNFFFVFLTVLLLTSCAPKVPPEAVPLSRSISRGIITLQENSLDLIDAWEEASYHIVKLKWSEIYKRANEIYWKKRTLPENDTPTTEQNEEIAALATLINNELNKKVRDKANEMRRVVQDNSSKIKDMNDQLVRLLTSVINVIKANEALLDTVMDIVPVPSGLLNVN